MLHPFLKNVADFIERHRLLVREKPCLVALSGGADSMALLHSLLHLGYQVECAHCNFKLRGEESDRDEEFCKQQCECLGVKLHVAHFATREYAESRKVSIEMAARFLRYDFFEKTRVDMGADEIAVAHHRDDSVETVLLNLIRGTGLHGLTGIAPRNGRVVRPLLGVDKGEIQAFVEEMGVPFVTDSSNWVDDVVRNKIRLDILPLMRSINPSVAEAVAVTAERLRQAAEVFDEAMEQKVERACLPEEGGDGRAVYEIAQIKDEYTLFYILRQYGFTPAAVEDLYGRLDNVRQGASFKSATHELLFDRGRILIQPLSEEWKPMRLPVEGKYMLPGNRAMRVTKVKVGKDFVLPRSTDCVCLDAAKVKWPLELRTVADGDRFQPLGMKGRKLVSDFLTDRKINLFDKRRQWVLVDGVGSILWVVKQRIDHNYRVTPSTVEGVLIQLLEG